MQPAVPVTDDARRDQLAESALAVLGELGYARTSLREITNNAQFSDELVHTYFDDKIDLVIYAVQYYKAQCVHRYDGVVADSTTPDELIEGFAAKLGETIREEAPMHRLWYDLRAQSMFEPKLRDAVTAIDRALGEMVWRVVDRYAELVGRPLIAANSNAVYGMLDGLFQQALLAYADADESVLDSLAEQVRELMPLLVKPAG